MKLRKTNLFLSPGFACFKIAIASMVLATLIPAHAANIWDGGGGDNSTLTLLNWDNNLVPTGGSGVLTFGGSVRPSVTWDGLNSVAPVNFYGITFAPGASAFTINTGTQTSFQFTNPNSSSVILNSSSNLQTLKPIAYVFYNGTKTFDGGAAGLALDGGISFRGDGLTSGQSNKLILSGSGDSTTTTISQLGTYASGTSNSLTKSGIGKWTVTGLSATAINNYSGPTTIDQGTLAFTTTNPTLTGNLTFGASAGASNKGTLDLSAASATFNGAFLVQTNSATANAISIGTGRTLTLKSSVTVGYNSAGNSTTKLDVTGLGTFSIGTSDTPTNANVQIGNGATSNFSNAATMDLSGLSTFYANLGSGSFVIGSPTNSGSASAGGSTVILAADSTIRATTLTMGSPDANVTQSLKLGSGTNVLNVDTINLAAIGASNGRSSGSLTFNGATGTLKIRSLADPVGGRATLNVGNMNMNTGIAQTANLFDTVGHSADLLFGTMTIGSRSIGNAATTGEFKFDMGTLDADNLIAGNRSGTAGSAATATGIVSLGGGTVAFNNTSGPIQLGVNLLANGTSSGTLNISGGTVGVAASGGSSIRLGNATVSGGTANGLLNLTGGTLTVAGDIVRGANTGTSNAEIRISGGTLDMGGNDIGAAVDGVITLTAESGELRNVATINGTGGLTKTTAGTLILSGTNSYIGATTVSAGTLLVNGSLGADSDVAVGADAYLGGTGIIQGDLSFNGASFLTISNIADALAVSGNITFGSGFGIDNIFGLNWDSLDLGTPYTLLAASQSFDGSSIENFGIANQAPVGTGRFAYFENGSLAVIVIPEPSSMMLAAFGMLALLRRRRA